VVKCKLTLKYAVAVVLTLGAFEAGRYWLQEIDMTRADRLVDVCFTILASLVGIVIGSFVFTKARLLIKASWPMGIGFIQDILLRIVSATISCWVGMFAGFLVGLGLAMSASKARLSASEGWLFIDMVPIAGFASFLFGLGLGQTPIDRES
jgi:hypothetical protein